MEAFPNEIESTAPSAAEDPAIGLDHRAKMEILGAILLGMFLAALDQTIVGPFYRPSSRSSMVPISTPGWSRSSC